MELQELLGELHLELGKNLLEKVKNGEMDARLLKEAREYLKDNDIKYDTELKDKHIEQLAESVIEIEGLDQETVEGFKMVNHG